MTGNPRLEERDDIQIKLVNMKEQLTDAIFRRLSDLLLSELFLLLYFNHTFSLQSIQTIIQTII